MSTTLTPSLSAMDSSAKSLSGSARAWGGYQGGRDPYFTLVSIYIFMP